MKTKSYHIMSGVAFAIVIMLVTLIGCTTDNKKKSAEMPEEEAIVVVEVDYWVIDEHQMNDIPLTSKAKPAVKPAVKEESNAVEEAGEKIEDQLESAAAAEDEYEITTTEVLNTLMQEHAYEPVEEIEEIEVTEAIIPLDETQTLVAYNKKGEAKDMVQVISGPDGEVEQIIFTDKKHQDVYDVQAGMSAKEVKKLRKELKHLKRDGKYYLYDDQSNVMYLLDAVDSEGNEIMEVDIDTMEVEAIIWKDKKHHKKN